MNAVITQQYNVTVNSGGINWCRRISDAIEEVSHIPMSL
jgi:hypothetical protein